MVGLDGKVGGMLDVGVVVGIRGLVMAGGCATVLNTDCVLLLNTGLGT